MEYKVKLTDQFLDEFEEICDYISNKWWNRDASNRLREKVIYNILLLENSPRMCTEIEKVNRNGKTIQKNDCNQLCYFIYHKWIRKSSLYCTYILWRKKLLRWGTIIKVMLWVKK